MAQDTLLGFPAHTLPYRRGKLTTLSTVSSGYYLSIVPAFLCPLFGKLRLCSQKTAPPVVV